MILLWEADISLAGTALFQELDVKPAQTTGDASTRTTTNQTSPWFLKSAH